MKRYEIEKDVFYSVAALPNGWHVALDMPFMRLVMLFQLGNRGKCQIYLHDSLSGGYKLLYSGDTKESKLVFKLVKMIEEDAKAKA